MFTTRESRIDPPRIKSQIKNCKHYDYATSDAHLFSDLGYIYYHCTSGKGSCEGVTYLREELIEERFAAALATIQVPNHIVEWTRQALLETHQEEKELHLTKVVALEKRYRTLQAKINKSYEDKLDGHIDHDFWIAQTSRWKQEQSDIEGALAALRATNSNSMDQGMKLMELASRAASLFKNMTNDEKREMMNLVLSNPRMLNGSVEYDFKKPFSMFVNVVDLQKWRG